MNAMLHCLRPPKFRTPEPSPTHVCADEAEPDPGRVVNRSGDHMKLEFEGKALTVSAWARRIGVTRQTIYQRLNDGQTVEQALSGRKCGR